LAKIGVEEEAMLGNADAFIAAVKFDGNGLVPVIAQDRATGVIRMLAWANAEALHATITKERATFWSRSRKELWEKGATSGNSMKVHDVRLDCDGDAVLYVVDAKGPSCHTNATSCFFRTVGPAGLLSDDGPASCKQL
jgi:phosphoribosyl-AMP cyclohydrolase